MLYNKNALNEQNYQYNLVKKLQAKSVKKVSKKEILALIEDELLGSRTVEQLSNFDNMLHRIVNEINTGDLTRDGKSVILDSIAKELINVSLLFLRNEYCELSNHGYNIIHDTVSKAVLAIFNKIPNASLVTLNYLYYNIYTNIVDITVGYELEDIVV